MSADELKEQGKAAFSAGNYEEAISLWSKSIELDSENHLLYSNRSAAYCKVGKYKLALDDADKVIALKPDWPKGYARKATAYRFMDQYSNAAMTYMLGLQECPEDDALKQGVEEMQVLIQQRQAQLTTTMTAGQETPLSRVLELVEEHQKAGDSSFPAAGTLESNLFDAHRLWQTGLAKGMEGHRDAMMMLTDAIALNARACVLENPIEQKASMFYGLMMASMEETKAIQSDNIEDIFSNYRERIQGGATPDEIQECLSITVRGPFLMAWFCAAIQQFGDATTPLKHVISILDATLEDEELASFVKKGEIDVQLLSPEFIAGVKNFYIDTIIGGYLQSKDAFGWALEDVFAGTNEIVDALEKAEPQGDFRHAFMHAKARAMAQASAPTITGMPGFGGMGIPGMGGVLGGVSHTAQEGDVADADNSNKDDNDQVTRGVLQTARAHLRGLGFMNRAWYHNTEKNYSAALDDFKKAGDLLLRGDQKVAIARYKQGECKLRLANAVSESGTGEKSVNPDNIDSTLKEDLKRIYDDAKAAEERSKKVFGGLADSFPSKKLLAAAVDAE
eukprot:Rmarinus@m.519